MQKIVKPPNNQIEMISEDQPSKIILKKAFLIINIIAVMPDTTEIKVPK